MECPSIHNLKFDRYGELAIEDIRDVYDFSRVLNPVLVAGTAMTAALNTSNRDQLLFFSSVAKGCRLQ